MITALLQLRMRSSAALLLVAHNALQHHLLLLLFDLAHLAAAPHP
jgi:hypothetical protein